jgi:hypothetical protein
MPISKQEISNLFTYQAPREEHISKYEAIRNYAKFLAELIVDKTPDCREQRLALANIEQAVMWANAAIARHS